MRDKVLGPTHPDSLKSKGNYALTLKCLNRFEEAEKLQLEVIKNAEEILGSLHPDTITLKGNYAITLLVL